MRWEVLGATWWVNDRLTNRPVNNPHEATWSVTPKERDDEARLAVKMKNHGRIRVKVRVITVWQWGFKGNDPTVTFMDIAQATFNVDFIAVQLKLDAVPKVLAARCQHTVPFYFEFEGPSQVLVKKASAELVMTNKFWHGFRPDVVITRSASAELAQDGKIANLLSGDWCRGTAISPGPSNGDTNQYTLLMPPSKLADVEFFREPILDDLLRYDLTPSHRSTDNVTQLSATLQVTDDDFKDTQELTCISGKVTIPCVLDRHIPIYEFGRVTAVGADESLIQFSQFSLMQPLVTLRYLGNAQNNTNGKKKDDFYSSSSKNNTGNNSAPYAKPRSLAPNPHPYTGPAKEGDLFFWKGGDPAGLPRVPITTADLIVKPNWIDNSLWDYDFQVSDGSHHVQAHLDPTKRGIGPSSLDDFWELQVGGRQYGVFFVVYYGFRMDTGPIDRHPTDLANQKWDGSDPDCPPLIDLRRNNMAISCDMFKDSKVYWEVADAGKGYAKVVADVTKISNNMSRTSGWYSVIGSLTAPAPFVSMPFGLASGVTAVCAAEANDLAVDLSLGDPGLYSQAQAEVFGYLTVTDEKGQPAKGPATATTGEIHGYNDTNNTWVKPGGNQATGDLSVAAQAQVLTTWQLTQYTSATALIRQLASDDTKDFSAKAKVSFKPSEQKRWKTSCNLAPGNALDPIGNAGNQIVGEGK